MESINNGIEQLTHLILPSQTKFILIKVNTESALIKLTVQTRTVEGTCPDCKTTNHRVHSHAKRIVKDLPISGSAVILQLRLRRFFCDNAACTRKTFTERLPGIIEPYAHRTNRLLEMQRSVGFLSGGETGVRLSRCFACPTSADSLIRYVRTPSLLATSDLLYLGIDDWAFKKGRSYGTILVNLETHRPVDLLPDRDQETVAK